MNLKKTLNLPRTSYPMRGNLTKREPDRIAYWENIGLYDRMQKKNILGPIFVLHDGPPFTSGIAHIGTGLNKILKDIILHFKCSCGFRTPYVPGWDCHGLPIEYKVVQQLHKVDNILSPAELRKYCTLLAYKAINIQRAQFKRLGILADWGHEYKTMDPVYEAEILRTFASFVEKGLIYRSKKPIYWSIPCKTVLAEAEVEYKECISTSIWVKFNLPEHPFCNGMKVYIVIWTTTPWTLPANLAVAVCNYLDYSIISYKESLYLVASTLVKPFVSECSFINAYLNIEKIIKGEDLMGLQAYHPFIRSFSPIVFSENITTDKGTGCVHIAPAHGFEDYSIGLKYNLDIYCPLNDQGYYINDGYIPQSLIGLSVLKNNNGQCTADYKVIEILEQNGMLLKISLYKHLYPYCWRSNTPVILRAMNQWFITLDSIKKKAIEGIKKIKFIPYWGKDSIYGAIKNRSNWCISRQRSWGVPIPVFFDSKGNTMLDANVIRNLASKLENNGGSQVWFTKSNKELLDGVRIPKSFQGKTLYKEMDTMDVWIGSGCSHRVVLKENLGLSTTADLYLEGSDQHRGWFQSSLWTRIITNADPPYKNVLTHGFVVDEKGEKMSKSKGGMSINIWINKYGADIVRLWVSSQDLSSDIRLSEKHFKIVSSVYRSIRNTLRFQIGNLHDFNPDVNSISACSLDPIDQWALNKTQNFVKKCKKAYEEYAFHKVFQEVDSFVGVTLSRIYHDILKDRLYTYGPDWRERRSSQTAIRQIILALCVVIAPIIPLTADEAYSYLIADSEYCDSSVHLKNWPQIDHKQYNTAIVNDIDCILAFREKVNLRLENQRQRKIIGQSLDAKVTIFARSKDPILKLLKRNQETLCELFIVSEVVLQEVSDEQTVININITHADGERCPRSWRWVPELVDIKGFGSVSPRDRRALFS